MTDSLALICLVLGAYPRNAFSVNVDGNDTVERLKTLIKDKIRLTIPNVADNQLSLWKVSIAYDNANAMKLLEDTAAAESLHNIDIRRKFYGLDLMPFLDISDYFIEPPKRHIHVIVDYPRGKLLPSSAILPISLPIRPHV